MQYARERTEDGRKLVDFAMDVLEGKPYAKVVKPAGLSESGQPVPEVTVMVTPDLAQRIDVMKFLADRAFGKPAQKLEGELRAPLSIIHRTPPHDPLAPKPDEERALDVEATLVPPRRALKP